MVNKKTSAGWGGPRSDSGRPPTGHRKELIAFRVDKELLAQLKHAAEASGAASFSEFIRMLLLSGLRDLT